MSNTTLHFPTELYQYYQRVGYREPAILQQLRQQTEEKFGLSMQISPEQGQFMQWLIQLTQAQRCIDVGTFTGYSALAVALSLPSHGEVIACDVDLDYTDLANYFWQQAGVLEKIHLHIAPAAKTLQSLIQSGEEGQFDFAFIDADKENYVLYYELCLQLIKPGGVIAIDNVLWGGSVANQAKQDDDTESIRELNTIVHQDNRINMSMIPIGDGLTLINKLAC